MSQVLIVDDIEQDLQLLKILLEAHSHDVITAGNGVEALRIARLTPPDLIVTDIPLPEMDGLQLCRHWKSDAVLKDKPLVFYTEEQKQQLALDVGADHFIPKQTKPTDLLAAIHSVLNQQHSGVPRRIPAALPVADPRLSTDGNLMRRIEGTLSDLQSTKLESEQRIATLQQAAENLHLQERALEAAPAGIVITDFLRPDNPIVYCNTAFQRITGYRREEILGRNCRFLQAGAADAERLREIREAINEGRGCRVVLENFRKDGSAFWNRLTLSPVFDATGLLTHYVGIQEDVTDEVNSDKERRRSQCLVRTVIDRIPQGALVVDRAADAVVLYNQQFLKLWGVQHLADRLVEGQLRATHLISSCVSLMQMPGQFLDAGRLVQDGGTVDEDAQLIDGRTIRLYCARLSTETPECRQQVYLFEDTTERKKLEKHHQETAAAISRLQILSEREREVLDLLFAGMANRLIGEHLGISERTVEKHRSNIMRKLQIDNVPELIRLRSRGVMDGDSGER